MAQNEEALIVFSCKPSMASDAYSQHSEDNICLNSPPDSSKPEQQGDKTELPTDLDVAGDEIPAIDDVDTSKKPVMSKRIWSREDEKEILKALGDFVDETGLRPYKEVRAFNDFLKKSRPHCVETSTRQLKGKIRRMRKKFAKSKSKFDFETVQLAHKIWAAAAAAAPVAEEEEEKKVLECECECEKTFAHVKDGGEVEEAAGLPSDGTVAKRMEPGACCFSVTEEEEKKVLECECECEKMFAHVEGGGEVEEAAALPSDGTVAKRMEPGACCFSVNEEEEKKVLECECECENMFAHVEGGGEVEEAAVLPSDGTVAKRMEPVSEQTLAIMEPLEMI